MQTDTMPLTSRFKQISLKSSDTVNETDQISQPPETRALESWRFTTSCGALATTVILIVNIVTLVTARIKYPVEDHSLAFFTGSCRTASMLTMMVHIIVNILSTVLLAASNFAMQCLNSPTRSEVDAAHARHRWLTIGTPSIRNLFYVSKSKVSLWIVLGASSFPLHMIWNSVVFKTHHTNNYVAVTVTENFTEGAYWTTPPFATFNKGPQYTVSHNRIERLQQQVQNRSLERLSAESCIKEYSHDFTSKRGDVLLVINASAYVPRDPIITSNASYMASGSSVLATYSRGILFGALHSKFDGANWTLPANPDNGDQGGAPVIYCYSEQTVEHCVASLVPTFMAIVIVCNVCKTVCLLLALYITRNNPPLCTIGDAIQSFLKDPDIYTQRRCLASKRNFERPVPGTQNWNRPSSYGDIWKDERGRWILAVNPWHWVLYIFSLATIITLAGVFANGHVGRETDIYITGTTSVSIMSGRTGLLSLGEPMQNSILASLLVTNVLQIAISYIYLGLNNILTTMLVMAEWCGYSAGSKNPPKGLRVSYAVPGTEQRATYFLSLPYKWGVPMMTCMAMVHWMATQIFTFARIDLYSTDPNGSSLISRTNYLYGSPDAVMYGMSVAGGISLVLLSFSIFMRFPSGMPLAGCCTASIAAACQPRKHDLTDWQQFDKDLAYKKLKWGVIQEQMKNGIGHATFSADNVKPLVKGELYN